ncbi:MAG TPA: MOSC domain-containing protein [Gammaproteobacteria bacterium]|nr:MOSC domain-containing protein [Gammaproteobacteria bacterium]
MPAAAVPRGGKSLVNVSGLYTGGAAVLEASGQRSGIVKSPQARVQVMREGLAGDVQVDRRYHGGPEQAVHQFALRSYAALLAAFPALATRAVAGSIGENLSCAELDEDSVCVGDVHAIGEVELQVSQPRRPCTKIDARYGVDGIARWLAARRMPGWYYRVLKPGTIALGDPVTLIARPNPEVPLARLLAASGEACPSLAELERLLACAGLGADWRRRLQERLAFQRERSP